MSERDYYEILGVSKSATDKEIRQAYRKLAMRYHPDRNPDDKDAEIKFKEAAEAYDVLRDPEKRKRYDQFGHAGMGGGFASHGFGSAEDIFSHFSDIFGDLFGFGASSRGPRPEAGPDLRYNLTITFAQAAHGDEVTLQIPKHVTCPECEGSRAAPGSKLEDCRQCGGTGQIRRNQGFFQIAMPCPACDGTGKRISKPCPRCKGDGIINDKRKITVRIPAGVDNGMRLRVHGEGEPGLYGGPPGDLYVVLTVEPDNRWHREGSDLIYHQDISFVRAALGHKVEVPGINGPLSIEIPKGVQNGKLLRIEGEGMPVPGRDTRGDLLVAITVVTPTDLNERQEELLREFEKAGEEGAFAQIKKAAKKIGKAIGLS